MVAGIRIMRIPALVLIASCANPIAIMYRPSRFFRVSVMMLIFAVYS
jgi:hypothetical protein